MATDNQIFDSIAQELYKSNSDEKIRLACQAREDFNLHERRTQEKIDELTRKNDALQNENNALHERIAQLKELLKEQTFPVHK